MLASERVTLTHRLGVVVAAVSTVRADSVAVGVAVASVPDVELADALGLAEAELLAVGVGVGVGVEVPESLGVLGVLVGVWLGVGLLTAGGVGLDEETGTLTALHC